MPHGLLTLALRRRRVILLALTTGILALDAAACSRREAADKGAAAPDRIGPARELAQTWTKRVPFPARSLTLRVPPKTSCDRTKEGEDGPTMQCSNAVWSATWRVVELDARVSAKEKNADALRAARDKEAPSMHAEYAAATKVAEFDGVLVVRSGSWAGPHYEVSFVGYRDGPDGKSEQARFAAYKTGSLKEADLRTPIAMIVGTERLRGKASDKP